MFSMQLWIVALGHFLPKQRYKRPELEYSAVVSEDARAPGGSHFSRPFRAPALPAGDLEIAFFALRPGGLTQTRSAMTSIYEIGQCGW
jgi:hypothetical protein